MLRKLAYALLAIAVLAGLTAWALSPPRYADPASLRFSGKMPGSVIAVERVGGHNRLVLSGLLMLALPARVPISDGAELLRIRYWSEVGGQPVEAGDRGGAAHLHVIAQGMELAPMKACDGAG